jgi:hypothetical protein
MSDPLIVGFGIVNSILAFVGVVITLYGQHYFQGGILSKTLRRATVVALILFVHYVLGTLADLSVIPYMPLLGEVLELAFTLGLAYLTYGLIRDWQKINVK